MGDWPTTIKTKVDLGAGKYGVTCWSEDGEAVDMPESWKDYVIKPRIVISNLWIFGSKFGPLLRLTDALLQPKPELEATVRCSPFSPIAIPKQTVVIG